MSTPMSTGRSGRAEYALASAEERAVTEGRDYYKLDGQQLRPPTRPELAPSREYLEWHASKVLRG